MSGMQIEDIVRSLFEIDGVPVPEVMRDLSIEDRRFLWLLVNMDAMIEELIDSGAIDGRRFQKRILTKMTEVATNGDIRSRAMQSMFKMPYEKLEDISDGEKGNRSEEEG